MSIRILIADDHGVLRAGLHALLETEGEMEVVAEAANGYEAIKKTEQVRPDVVLMDVNLGDISGLEVTRQLRRNHPQVRVLVLTVYEDVELLQEAVQAGAAGYVLKKASKSELMNAIYSAMRGEFYVHPSLTRAILAKPAGGDEPTFPDDPNLTPREVEVLKLIVKGYTNAQIGQKLSTSVRTVEYHRSNIMHKLGLSSRDQLVSYATTHNLI